MYKDDPVWADVTPLPIEEPEDAAAKIDYSEEFKDAMSYFRAILHSHECSKRVLDLTFDIIDMNPGNYTAWLYRRKVLESIDADYNEEQQLLHQLGAQFCKCYQYWYHRRCVVEKTGNFADELVSIAEALQDDSKNYHAWSLRQWVVLHFKAFDGEMEYTEKLIVEDIRNNSAWNYRMWLLLKQEGGITTSIAEKEVEYVKEKIKMAPSNESAWNYLMGIWRQGEPGASDSNRDFMEEMREGVKAVCEDYAERSASHIPRASLAEVLEFESDRPSLERAAQIYTDLAETHDTIRARYWLFRKKGVQSLLDALA
mmetsp:Transcript_9204/g.24950  ORF Transcript_9204/g.24950 Transcript_9204/m.24950 type:complete len:313 (-) Transcript_9204:377-1315(-)